jgi:hypothetical protein
VCVRRTLLSLVLLIAVLAVPAAAYADAPINDTSAGATPLTPSYGATPSVLATIPPLAPGGGWVDATSTEDMFVAAPSCLGAAGFRSMWYLMDIPEASVLTVQLKSSSVDRYRPVVTIINPVNGSELACGLGGNDARTDPGALASSYVPTGKYLIRVAAVDNSVITGSNLELPTVTLLGTLVDVTPPQIQVSVSGKAKIIGVNKTYTFDASNSQDLGSGIEHDSAVWTFYDHGQPLQPTSDSKMKLTATYAWKTPGLHRVTLRLSDNSKNTNTYSFNVLVHNFVPPRVSLRVYVPSVGSREIHLKLTHDVPIRARLVVMQGAKVLRAIPAKLLKGSHVTSSLRIALTKKVRATDFVVVSGVASDIGQYPNTVPLVSCSVDPVHGGGTCA